MNLVAGIRLERWMGRREINEREEGRKGRKKVITNKGCKREHAK